MNIKKVGAAHDKHKNIFIFDLLRLSIQFIRQKSLNYYSLLWKAVENRRSCCRRYGLDYYTICKRLYFYPLLSTLFVDLQCVSLGYQASPPK